MAMPVHPMQDQLRTRALQAADNCFSCMSVTIILIRVDAATQTTGMDNERVDLGMMAAKQDHRVDLSLRRRNWDYLGVAQSIARYSRQMFVWACVLSCIGMTR